MNGQYDKENLSNYNFPIDAYLPKHVPVNLNKRKEVPFDRQSFNPTFAGEDIADPYVDPYKLNDKKIDVRCVPFQPYLIEDEEYTYPDRNNTFTFPIPPNESRFLKGYTPLADPSH